MAAFTVTMKLSPEGVSEEDDYETYWLNFIHKTMPHVGQVEVHGSHELAKLITDLLNDWASGQELTDKYEAIIWRIAPTAQNN